ncbi:MAG: TauD/TfdA family dioxygenase [Sphingomonadales bacterium]|nr:TauD/TfdA family dioxygenase [Sphingomonadales bacterium]
MEIEWLPGNVLLTEHRAQGCVEAENGAILWFNQSHVFHPANQAPAAQAQLVQLLGADRLPRQSYYGDRSVILPEIVARVNDVFNSLTHEMRWQRGDVIILDNLRFAHGRMPFKGARRLHVAMANSQSTPRRTPLFSHV